MRYGDTSRALEDFTDDRAFEKLATILLSRTGMNLRPLGGPGDRGRDAVAGLYRSEGGEEVAIAISLEERWPAKVRADLARITGHGLKPASTVFVTNRRASPGKQTELQQWARTSHGIDLTVHDQRWLVARLYLRENLDVLREFLGLEPPRPHFFLDLTEYEELLAQRHLLDSHFEGRRAELQALERQLDEANAVVLEAPGGFGKSRLVFELAASGESATPWFFVDAGLPFEVGQVAEAGEGYEVTIFVDDAHRRPDLETLLHALERRQPAPRLVFAVRPGHAAAVRRALHGLALPQPVAIAVGTLGRSDLGAMLREKPFEIERDAMLSAIIGLSEGNVGVAVMAGALAAEGADPLDLSKAGVFKAHIDSRLKGACLESRENRELLALIAGLGVINFAAARDIALTAELLGISEGEIRRRVDEFADAGFLVEESAETYTLKPDIVREHVQRFSFFPETGRPILRFSSVYERFGHRRADLLSAIGESAAESAASAGATIALVRRDLRGLLASATTVEELLEVAALTQRLGAGGSGLAVEIATELTARIDDLAAAEIDRLASAVVEILAAAKFGRDRFPEAWEQLLRLARRVHAHHEAAKAQEVVSKEITDIFGSAPMNYSARDFEVLGYMQDVVRSQSAKWWTEEREAPGAEAVAALLVGPAFTLQLEQHRQAAGNAMAINLVAGFVPAWEPTERLLELGAELFEATFLQLQPVAQIKQLEQVDRVAHVAGGYPGILSTMPDESLQDLCENVLLKIEQWLADHLEEMPLPVAAAALDQLRRRRTRVGGRPARRKVVLPRLWGDLREYVDLVDHHPRRARIRLDWQKEHDETRRRGARYGAKLAKSPDAMALVRKWNGWIAECEAAARSVNHVPLMAAFGELARANPGRARELAETIVREGLGVGRFIDELLELLAQDRANWSLIRAWTRSPDPHVRATAARSVGRAPEDLARPIFRNLAGDSDEDVRATVWHGVLYYADRPLKGWRLDLALQLAEASASPLSALDQLLGKLRHQGEREGTKPALTRTQQTTVKRIVIRSAHEPRLPRNHRVKMALDEAAAFGLDLVLPWMRERLEFIRSGAAARYAEPLPDELQLLVHVARNTAAGKRELERLLDELEKPTTTGLYRMAVDEAVAWLGADSAAVTRRIPRWATGSEREVQLAHQFVASGNWRVFTRRARLLLDTRPDDADVEESLITLRHPRSFMGSRAPYFRARADEYRRWLKHRDARLRRIARKAIEYYERAANSEEERERTERDAI